MHAHTHAGIPSGTTLAADQADFLVQMQEEEKLARDVYEAMNALYPRQPFANIMAAEQTHMDLMWAQVVLYQMTARVANVNTRGVYADTKLQKLYDDLVAKGSKSLKDALEVGVAVEELDISDLVNRPTSTIPAIAAAMDKLLSGSYSHLAAYNKALAKLA